MADQVFGGAFLSLVFDRIASKEVLDLFRGEKVINKLLAELKSALRSANALLNDAEEKQLRDQDVRQWLQEIKKVITKADNVTDKISTEVLRRKVEGSGEYGSSTSALISSAIQILPNAFDNVVVRSEIEEILHDLTRLLREKDFLGLQKVDSKRPSQRPVAPFVEESGVYGREDDKRKIIDLLLSDDSTKPNVSVIPIVGMGGIGKTTLAQLVYRDSSVIEHFNLKVWVTVSDEFDVFGITKVIFENITERGCRIKDLYKLQSELIKSLEGKKFLFILDDVWNENYDLWDSLKSSFVSKARGSRIIVTTRSKIVASKMGDVEPHSLEIISNDQGWDLFAKHVFNNANSDEHPELKRIGKEIVKKCKGLPLAVRSIAGVLRSVLDPNEWRLILESDIWELELREIKSTNVLPALFLSYQYLPLNLKRCFAYLSIFPKDHEFFERDREKIILPWMAEGLLQHENQKRAEDVGEEYLNTLISRSFFQRSNQFSQALVMHDLMHDLALFVSGSDKCWRTYLDLSRSFHADVWNDRVKLRGGEYLRALSLSRCTDTNLLSSIGNLKHLRYLDLSRTEIEGLPSSLCTLYNLQTLLLEGCRKLTHLPTNMCHLINLRHLDIKGTSLKEMPSQMCAMTNLQTLSYFVLGGDDGSRIKDLGELQFLRGSLHIAGLENVRNVSYVKAANFKNKKHLSQLVLQWKSASRDPEMEVEVLNALEPHSGLNEVEVMGYGGTKFPNWVARQSFHDMVIVRLKNCRNCLLLPPFGQLPSLKELEIGGMDKVVVIGDDFCGTPCSSTCNPFPCLEGLSIDSMEALEKWAFTGADQEGAVLFPRLKILHITSCKKLSVGLPTGCFPALEQITIDGCESMVSVFPGTHLAVQEIDTSYPSLRSIRVMRCESLESFSEMGLPSHLNRLEIYNCGRLISNRFSWDLQRLSSLESLSLTESVSDLQRLCSLECLVLVESSNSEEAGGIEGSSFPEEGLLPTSLNVLRIHYFKKLKGLNGKGLRHLTSLEALVIDGCRQLECLPEEGLPRSLTNLQISECPLLRERCQRGAGQDWPKIQHIPTIRIDFSNI